MDRLTVQSELLMELSDEQQEIVSGGISLADAINTNFSGKQETLAFGADAHSGPDGSHVTQLVAADFTNINTSAAKAFTLSFDPGDSMVSI